MNVKVKPPVSGLKVHGMNITGDRDGLDWSRRTVQVQCINKVLFFGPTPPAGSVA